MKGSAGTQSLMLRFLALFLQICATIVLYDEKYYNEAAALRFERFEDDESFKTAYFNIDFGYSWLVASSMVCNFLEVLTMSLGHPSTSSAFNLSAAVLHLVGFFLTFYMLIQPWRIQIFAAVFALSSAIPLILSSLFVIDRIVLHSSLLRRINIRI